jgi:integrase/recombinase XerD
MPRPAKKSAKRPIEVLTPAEVSALLRQCSTAAPTGIRNRALITVLYRGALRINEALELTASDINPAEGTIRVLHGKGDEPRTAWVDEGAMAMIQRWMDIRNRYPRRTCQGRRGAYVPLFCTLKGGPLNDRYVRPMLHRIADAKHANIGKRVHPHGFRHSWSHDRAMEGVPAVVIQAQLGHKHLSTTDAYLRDIAPADVIATLRKMVPKWELE